MMRNRLLLPFTIVMSLCLLALTSCQDPYEFDGFAYESPVAAAEIVGTNWDGREFRLSDQQGKVTLIFFGYTFCPDICPMTLANMAQLYESLEADAADLSVVFVSTDPDRDTPEQLAAYVPQFNKNFFGVHIPEAPLTTVKQGYGVFSEKRFLEGEEDPDTYFVDHTGAIYIIDQEGLLRLLHKVDSSAEGMLADIRHLIHN